MADVTEEEKVENLSFQEFKKRVLDDPTFKGRIKDVESPIPHLGELQRRLQLLSVWQEAYGNEEDEDGKEYGQLNASFDEFWKKLLPEGEAQEFLKPVRRDFLAMSELYRKQVSRSLQARTLHERFGGAMMNRLAELLSAPKSIADVFRKNVEDLGKVMREASSKMENLESMVKKQ